MTDTENPFARFGPRIKTVYKEVNPFAQFGPRRPITTLVQAETPTDKSGPLINLGRGVAQSLGNQLIASAQSLGHGYAALVNKVAPESDYAKAVMKVDDDYKRRADERERDYQARTAGSIAAGVGRFAGDLLPFLLTGGGSLLAKSGQLAQTGAKALGASGPLVQKIAQLLGQTTGSAAAGASASLLQPVTQGDFATEKAKQAVLGGIAGALTVPAAGALSRVISPKASRNPQVQTLLKEGITPTPGQILGHSFKATEEKLSSVPILGDAIHYARGKAIEDLNRATYARAMNPIGQKASVAVGREGVDATNFALSQDYETLLPKLTFKADAQFVADIKQLQRQTMRELPEDKARQFERILHDQIRRKLAAGKAVPGNKIKEVESELKRQSSNFSSSSSVDDRNLGEALSDASEAIRAALQRTNPSFVQQLQKIDQGYKSYAVIRRAAASSSAPNGVFTPHQLALAVRAKDKSVDKGAYAKGRAWMQDLSDAGVSVLGSKYPDSGTAGRLLLSGGALGSGLYQPSIPLTLMGLSAPYLPFMNKLAAAALARRPQGAQRLAQRLPQMAPIASWGVAPAVTRE